MLVRVQHLNALQCRRKGRAEQASKQAAPGELFMHCDDAAQTRELQTRSPAVHRPAE